MKEFSRTYFQLILIYMVFKDGKGSTAEALAVPPLILAGLSACRPPTPKRTRVAHVSYIVEESGF